VRILHVIQELEMGGAERVVVTLAAGAREAGHEVAVASAAGALRDELDGEQFELPLVRRRPWRVALAARALGRALRAWQPDLLHCHNAGMALVASLATRRGREAPGLVTFHGIADEDYGAAARSFRLAALPVVACGPGVETGLLERGLRPLTTIVNGISPAPPPADREALEAELGLPAGRPLLVSVGRLIPQKEQLTTIRAVGELPEATLLLVGEGPLRTDLERQVAEQGLDGRVIFTGVRRDARAVVGAADAFVLSSAGEGLPLAALEALSGGTPVVATAVRGTRELFTDGETALLTPAGDAAGLAAALARVLTDPALAARLAEGGRELAAGFTDTAMVERYLELYERLARS
jgi:glycosyltransferase involved in cell wall biosynthesis